MNLKRWCGVMPKIGCEVSDDDRERVNLIQSGAIISRRRAGELNNFLIGEPGLLLWV